MPATPSSLSQLLGLRVASISEGGGASLMQQVDDRIEEERRNRKTAYLSGASLAQASPLSQWLATNVFGN